MKITIISHLGGEKIQVVMGLTASRGYDPMPNFKEKLLEILFRQFNRVDDNELISIFGIKMPSLSVGDSVIFTNAFGEHMEYRCMSVGWTQVPAPEPEELPKQFDLDEKTCHMLVSRYAKAHPSIAALWLGK